MAAALYLIDPANPQVALRDIAPVVLDSDGYYWFLYRYFESANLERHKGELIDLYGGGVIEGYQLHRFETELQQALAEVNHKPDSWQVLVGWKGESMSVETEEWRTVERQKLIQLIESLLALVHGSSNSRKLVCDGD
ncbi:hypothetical protein [Methylibium rhizosphaerae]|uniref:hypothetical protein n=1 Tax=Methylibium rhizosphaerae TaxID=2570323 RepID=UPI0011273389|nr:hypothetical protein [Methylibium rhizosphaerae]